MAKVPSLLQRQQKRFGSTPWPNSTLELMSIRIPPVASYVFSIVGIPAIYGVLAQLAYSAVPLPSAEYLFSVAAFLIAAGAFLVSYQIQLGLILRAAAKTFFAKSIPTVTMAMMTSPSK